jgi:hypothetical protein
VDPPDVFVSVHEDANGRARVLFVMNPTSKNLIAKISLPGAARLEDLLPDARASRSSERILGGRERALEREAGSFPVEVAARTVRLFAVRLG